MVIRNVLLATDAGLGHGETCIFPIHIFKVKEGVNYNEDDPNYDLFKLSMKVSAQRLFPNYVFLDSPFNLQYYKPGHPETEVATMGCRTRVMGNVYDPDRQISYSRGQPFLHLHQPAPSGHREPRGREAVLRKAGRYDGTGSAASCWIGLRSRPKSTSTTSPSSWARASGWIPTKLGLNDTVREVLKHGTLSIGFIGLAETLTALYRPSPRRERRNAEKGPGNRDAICGNTATKRARSCR